jgi:hypothetical protein
MEGQLAILAYTLYGGVEALHTPPEGTRKYFGALLLGDYAPDGLLFPGGFRPDCESGTEMTLSESGALVSTTASSS